MKERINIITILIFFIIIIVYVGCENKKSKNDINNNDNLISNGTHEKTTLPKVINLQEQIKNYDEEMVFLFQEEGNFTNSGNMELLAFYQSKSSLSYGGVKNSYVSRVYCFICDESNQTIQKVIKVTGYGTLPFDDKNNFDKISMDVLGREIHWLGHKFGYIGDFNNNGKEELYFFEVSGRGIYPAFYEFQEDQFELILKNNFLSVIMEITNIDEDNKIIAFKGIGGEKPENVSFIWDSNNQIYKFINIGNTKVTEYATETNTKFEENRQTQ